MCMKKVLLICVLLLPGIIYLFIETSTGNFKKVPYFGPRRLKTEHEQSLTPKGDTLYFQLPEFWVMDSTGQRIRLSDIYPGESFTLMMLDNTAKGDVYGWAALLQFCRYKTHDIKSLPFAILVPRDSTLRPPYHPAEIDTLRLDKKQFKIYYVDALTVSALKQHNYYTPDKTRSTLPNLVLIDKNMHIRGYYDGHAIGDITKLIEDQKHLKTRDESDQTTEQNKVEKRSK